MTCLVPKMIPRMTFIDGVGEGEDKQTETAVDHYCSLADCSRLSLSAGVSRVVCTDFSGEPTKQ